MGWRLGATMLVAVGSATREFARVTNAVFSTSRLGLSEFDEDRSAGDGVPILVAGLLSPGFRPSPPFWTSSRPARRRALIRDNRFRPVL